MLWALCSVSSSSCSQAQFPTTVDKRNLNLILNITKLQMTLITPNTTVYLKTFLTKGSILLSPFIQLHKTLKQFKHDKTFYFISPYQFNILNSYNLFYIIILERIWHLENDCSYFHLRSVTNTPSSLLCLPPLGRLAPQAGMVPAEGTPTLKSVGVLALGCQSTIDNDVPFSLKCVLFILP